MKAQRRKSLYLRIQCDAGFIPVAAKLATDNLSWVERPHGVQQAQLLRAHCVRITARRRVHRQQRYYLQQVILHHVPNCADLFVEAATTPNAESFSHRYLDTIDEISVPDRLEECIGKAEIKQILYRLLAQIVVD